MKLDIRKSDLSQLERQAGNVAETLGAMANANRLLILCHLASGEKTVSQIVDAISVAQSPVSQHLAKMRMLKLIKARRDGKKIYYSLASEAVTKIMQTLYSIYCEPQSTQRKK